MKQRVKINESQLKNIVTESVKRILKEIYTPKKRTFRFDDTPQGNYDKMVRYEGMIGTLDDILNKMIKLSGKSSTMDPQDSIDTKVWNLAHEIKSLIERYGLDSMGFNPDDYYPGDEFYPELQTN